LPTGEKADPDAEILVLPNHGEGFPDQPPRGTVANVDFEDFVRAERSKLIRFLMNNHASVHEAEEAAQRALIEAWRKWETIISPHAWVHRVALREFWKSAPGTRTDREQLTAHPPEKANVPSAADVAEITAWEREVCAEIAELPPQQRQVAILRYEGYSNREIADRLGVDASAVRHNVLRAKTRLRQLRENRQEDAG
jgi:RNA polymerase sigma factor (sigma-70 family)